jgi:hypothetical protein
MTDVGLMIFDFMKHCLRELRGTTPHSLPKIFFWKIVKDFVVPGKCQWAACSRKIDKIVKITID